MDRQSRPEKDVVATCNQLLDVNSKYGVLSGHMEKILKLQWALFFQNPIARPDTLMHGINASMGNLFDGAPQILPIPPEVPADVPRVQMRSENGKYNCNIACSRLDFILDGSNQNETSWAEMIQDFLAKVKLFTAEAFKESKFIRFGLIGNFFIPDNAASSSMTRKYLKVDLNTAEEINLRFNKGSSSFGFQLNNITSISTAFIDINGNAEKGIFIELDVNNIPTLDITSQDDLLQLVEKHIPSFAPSKVKGLVK